MDCDMSDYFEKIGRYWVIRNKDGEPLPIFYCPFCGQKIDYDNEDKE